MKTRTKWTLTAVVIFGIGLYAFAPCWLPGDDQPPHVIARAVWLYGSAKESSYGIGTMDVDRSTSAEELSDDDREPAFTSSHVGIVERKVEFDKQGNVMLSDVVTVMRWDGEAEYKLILGEVGRQIALRKDGSQFAVWEVQSFEDDGSQVRLLLGDREGIQSAVALGLNGRVHSMQYNSAGDKILCVIDQFKDDPVRFDALIVSTTTNDVLHSLKLPSGTRYAIWSREKDSIDCIVLDRLSLFVLNIRLSDGHTKTILSHRVRGLKGGRGYNVGPDGLVRFYVRTLYLPNGDLAGRFDGWPYHYVYDVEQRRLFSLNADLGWVVLVRK